MLYEFLPARRRLKALRWCEHLVSLCQTDFNGWKEEHKLI